MSVRRQASRGKHRTAPNRSQKVGLAAGLSVLVVFAVLVGAGCSHTAPYYRDGFEPLPPPDLAGIDHRLVLIGDAGDPDPDGEPSLAALAHQAALLPERTTVVFLGDNVYPTGMPEETFVDDTFVEEAEDVVDEVFLDLFASRKDAERRIDSQIDAVRGSGARAIFIPGNHGWDQFGVGGWERVKHLEAYIDQAREETGADVSLLPRGGCPGPISTPLGAHGTLILLDTQW